MFENKAIVVEKSTGYRTTIDIRDLDEHLADYELTRDEVDVLTSEEATPRELAELIGSEMENANHHGATMLAEEVLSGLEHAGFDEKDQLKIIKLLGTSLYKTI